MPQLPIADRLTGQSCKLPSRRLRPAEFLSNPQEGAACLLVAAAACLFAPLQVYDVEMDFDDTEAPWAAQEPPPLPGESGVRSLGAPLTRCANACWILIAAGGAKSVSRCNAGPAEVVRTCHSCAVPAANLGRSSA